MGFSLTFNFFLVYSEDEIVASFFEYIWNILLLGLGSSWKFKEHNSLYASLSCYKIMNGS